MKDEDYVPNTSLGLVFAAMAHRLFGSKLASTTVLAFCCVETLLGPAAFLGCCCIYLCLRCYICYYYWSYCWSILY